MIIIVVGVSAGSFVLAVGCLLALRMDRVRRSRELSLNRPESREESREEPFNVEVVDSGAAFSPLNSPRQGQDPVSISRLFDAGEPESPISSRILSRPESGAPQAPVVNLLNDAIGEYVGARNSRGGTRAGREAPSVLRPSANWGDGGAADDTPREAEGGRDLRVAAKGKAKAVAQSRAAEGGIEPALADFMQWVDLQEASNNAEPGNGRLGPSSLRPSQVGALQEVSRPPPSPDMDAMGPSHSLDGMDEV